jgi:hypothetical protein
MMMSTRKYKERKESPLLICPICGAEGRGAAMKVWHFDKCRVKKKIEEQKEEGETDENG